MLKIFQMIRRQQILRDTPNPDAGGDDGGEGTSQDEGSEASAEETEAQGDSEFDEFGYEKTEGAEATPPAPEGKKVEEAKADDKSKQKKPDAKATVTPDAESIVGYQLEPLVEKEQVVIPPPPEPEKPLSTQEALGFEVDVKGLEKETAVKLVGEIKDLGLNEKAAQYFIDLKKQTAIAADHAAKQALDDVRAGAAKKKLEWDKELRTHPTFGGENFGDTLHVSAKVLKEFFPETQKMLTDNKGMLPPSVIRDLVNLGKNVLYKTEPIVLGEESAQTDEDQGPDAHLSFYE